MAQEYTEEEEALFASVMEPEEEVEVAPAQMAESEPAPREGFRDYLEEQPPIIQAIAEQESNLDPNAVSPTGVKGLMQVSGDTWRAYQGGPEGDRFDPIKSIDIGKRVYDDEYARFSGNQDLALAAYNGGAPVVINALRAAGYSMKEAANVDFAEIAPFINSGNPAKDDEIVNYVGKVHDKLKGIEAEPVDNQYSSGILSPNEIGNEEELKGAINNLASDPTFDALPAEDKISKLKSIYNTKKRWSPEADALIKDVSSIIWNTAREDEKPNFGEMLGSPSQLEPTVKDAKQSVAGWQQKKLKDLTNSGNNPLFYGAGLDEYLKAAGDNELEAYRYRQRSVLGEAANQIGSAVATAGRGFVGGVTGGIAAVPRLGGFEEAADAIESVKDFIPEPSRSFVFAVDENGYPERDAYGKPLTNFRAGVASAIGQVGSLFAGTSILKKAQVGTNWIRGYVLGTNALQTGNEAYKDAIEVGGTPSEGRLAALYSLPGAALDSLADLTVLGTGKTWVNYLDPWNKAKGLSLTIGKGALIEGGTEATQQYMQDVGTSVATGTGITSGRKVLEAGVAGGVVGGLVSGLTTQYKVTPFVPTPGQQGLLPGPPDRLGLPAPVNPTIYVKPEVNRAVGQLNLPAPAVRQGLPGVEIPLNLPPGVKRESLPDGQRTPLLTNRFQYGPKTESESAIELHQRATPEEHVAVAQKLQAFQKSLASKTVLTAEQASHISDDMLRVFEVNLTPEGRLVTVTRRSEWTPIDATTLEQVEADIEKTSLKLQAAVPPDKIGGVILSKQELKSLKRQLIREQARLQGIQESEAEAVGNAYAAALAEREEIENRLESAKNKRTEYRRTDAEGEKISQFYVNDIIAELAAHDAKNENLYNSENSRLGKVQQDLNNVTKLIDSGLKPLNINTIKDAEVNLAYLLKQRTELQRKQQAFETEEAQVARGSKQSDVELKKIAATKRKTLKILGLSPESQVDFSQGVPVGSNFIIPVNNKWFVVDASGNILGKAGHDFYGNAAREARGLAEDAPAYQNRSTEFVIKAPDERTRLTAADEKYIKLQVSKERVERERIAKVIAETRAKSLELGKEESTAGVKAKEKINKLLRQQEEQRVREKVAKQKLADLQREKARQKGEAAREKEYREQVKKDKKLWLVERRKRVKEEREAARKKPKAVRTDGSTTLVDDETLGLSSGETISAAPQSSFARRRLSRPRKPLGRGYTKGFVFSEDSNKEVKPQELFKEGQKIVTNLNKYIRIFQGGSMPARALGYLNWKRNHIKVGAHNDVMTMFHEITHAIDKSIIGKWDGNTGVGDYSEVPDKVIDALKDTADTFYPAPLNSDMLRIKEGFAMFFQHHLTGQPVQQDILNWYNSDFSQKYPEVYKSLEDLKKVSFEHFNQTPETYIRSTIVPRQNRSKAALKKYWTATNLLDKWVDSAQVLNELDSLTGGKFHIKDIRDADYRRAKGVANTIVHSHLVDIDGNRVDGMSIDEAFSLAKGKYPDLVSYLVARRVLATHDANLIEGVNFEDAQKTVANIERTSPEVVQAAENYWGVMNHVLDIVGNSSRMGRTFVDNLRKQNLEITGSEHGFYIPSAREGKSGKFNPFKARTGSTRSREDPIGHIQDSIEGMLNQAFHNRLKESIADAASGPEGNAIGLYVREVTGGDRKPLLDTYLAKMREDLGPDVSKKDSILYAYVASPFDGVSNDEFKVLSYMDGDKVRFFEVNPRVAEAFSDSLPDVVNSFWFKYLYRPGAQLLRPFATTFRTAFQIKQFVMDPPKAYRYIKTGDGNFKDLAALYKTLIFQALPDTLFYNLGLNNKGFTAMAGRLGVLNATQAGALQDVRSSLQAQFGKNILDAGAAKLDKFENFLSTPETATRVAAMRLELRRMGVTNPNQVLTPAQAMEAILAFKRSTTNYQIQGSSARTINLGTPFFTARIAELSRLPRDFKRNPGRMMAYGAVMMTYGLYHALAHNDEEWYQELDPESRMKASWYKVQIDGVDKLLYVPLDNWASLTYGLGQAIGSKMGEDPALPLEYKELAKGYFGNHAPISKPFEWAGYTEFLGPWGKELLQQYNNHDIYFDKDIVPKAFEFVDPKLQYTDYTTEFSKEVGALLGYSPIRIDHLIRSTAPAVSDVIQMGEGGLGIKEANEYQEYNVFVKALTKSGTASSNTDRSNRMFTDELIKWRENKVSETPEEATTRKTLEKINKDISNLGIFIRGVDDRDAREDARVKSRELLRQGIRIARGASETVEFSGKKGEADQIRKKEAAARKEDFQRRRGVFSGDSLVGDTSE